MTRSVNSCNPEVAIHSFNTQWVYHAQGAFQDCIAIISSTKCISQIRLRIYFIACEQHATVRFAQKFSFVFSDIAKKHILIPNYEKSRLTKRKICDNMLLSQIVFETKIQS